MRVLIIDSDKAVVRLLTREFESKGHKVDVATSAAEAIKISDKNKPHSVILELTLPGHSGTEFIYEFRTYNDWASVPIIIFSSMLIDNTILESQDWKLLNISSYFYKPKASLAEVVKSVLEP